MDVVISATVQHQKLYSSPILGNTFFWKANGTELSNGEKYFLTLVPLLVDEVQGLRMSMLRVKVASTDNATNITCTVIKLSPFSMKSIFVTLGSFISLH